MILLDPAGANREGSMSRRAKPGRASGERFREVAEGQFSPFRGSVKQKLQPWPRPLDSTQTRPPCISMICVTSARPIPVPSTCGSSCLKRPNTR